MSLTDAVFRIAAETSAFERSMSSVERRFEGMAGVARKVGAAIGVTFAAGQITRFIGEAIEAGDAMAKAAQKAGANVEQFSKLAYAAKLADVSLESLSASVKFMQKAIASGDDSIGAIGVSLSELQRLQPDKQFELLADAIAGIQDPAERTRRTLEIFGKAGSDLLPLFEQGAAGIRAAGEEADRLHLTLTENAARQLQQADDAIKKMTHLYDSFWRTVAIGAARSAEAIGLLDPDKFKQLSSEMDDLVARRRGMLSELRDMEGKGLTEGHIAQSTEIINGNLAKIEARMNAINSLLKGLGQQDVIVPITVSGAGSRRREAPVEPLGSLNPQMVLEMQRSFEAVDKMVAESATRHEAIAAGNASRLADLNAQFNEQVQAWVEETRDSNLRNLEAMAEDGKTAMDSISVFADQAARNMQTLFADFLFDPFKDGLKGMLSGFIGVLRRMVAEAAAAKLFEKITGGSGSGSSGFLGTILGAVFGGKKATGGYVSSGKGYLVGERGPEYFMPSASGTIVPNDKLATAGGPSVSIGPTYIDARGATIELIKALPEVLKRRDDALEAKIVDGLRRGRYGL